MVREFVLLRGGVSKYPAAGYRLAGRGSGRLLFHTKTHCWYFSPYLTEGHMDQITLKARPYTLKYIYTHRGTRRIWVLHKIFPTQLSKWEREIEPEEKSRERKGRKRVKVVATG